jgi:hypothetical protein
MDLGLDVAAALERRAQRNIDRLPLDTATSREHVRVDPQLRDLDGL